MKTQKILFAFVFAFISIASLHAETVDEIIAKHINAVGGLSAWKNLSSVRMEGTATAQGTDVQIVVTGVQKKAVRMDITVMGMTGYTILTPTGGWSFMPFQGQTKPEALTADDVKEAQDQLDLQGEFIDYKEKGIAFELLGKEDVEGTDCYKIKATFKNGKVRTDFIDPATYYVIKRVDKQKANGQEHEQTENFSNFKKSPEGLVFPMTISSGMGDMNVKKIDVNLKVDESIFKAQ